MAKFVAESAVEEMAWNFTKYGGGEGVIPEPSDLAIERFLRKFNIIITQVSRSAANKAAEADAELMIRTDDQGKERLLTFEESIEVLKKIDVSETNTSPEVSDAMLDLVANLTKGNPTKAQIKKLPNRVRGAFYGWLIGQLTNPEYSAAVTRPSLSLVNGG